ncbi:translation initiation factor III [Actinoplanes palleronii]|uniref:translation initiation factor III n=2 Tax=Actinoplanes palleronii TaxID=113570 RepID=UPI0031D6098C
MARSKNNERTASRVAVDIGSTGTRTVPTGAVILLVVSVLAAIWAVAMMTKPGRVGYVYFFTYAEFYMGVLTLVSLSITIMVGLISTDRLVLSIRQRVLLQSTHRTTGVMAISSLVVHLWTKTVEHHIRVIDIFIPFLTPTNTLYIGLGQISGYVLFMVTWSGLIRARFIGRGKPWMWRAIHSVSYLMWPIALMHGLGAGRPAATWVIVSYVVCVLAVLIGLAVRLSVSLNRRKDFSSAAGLGAVKPASTAPTAGTTRNRFGGGGGRGGADLAAPAEPATLSSWVPAAAPPAPPAAPPVPAPAAQVIPEPAMLAELEAPAPRQRRPVEDDRFDEPTRAISRREFEDDRYEEPAPRARRRDEEYYDDGPRPRSRRYADDEEDPRARRSSLEDTGARLRPDETGTRLRPDETGTRLRRDELSETGTRMRMEDTQTRMRRDELSETGTRMRMDDTQTRMRRYADDDEPAPRARRRADEDYYEEAAPRARRRADEVYEETPRPRAPRYEEEEPTGGRRRADDGRHSRSQFVDLADDQYTDDDSLVDTGSRRARRPSTEVVRGGGAPAAPSRRGRGRGGDDDDAYFSQLRGESN